MARSIAKKRGVGEDIGGAKRGRRKFPLLGEDWGESNDPQKIPNNEHSPTPKEDTAPPELQKIYNGGGPPPKGAVLFPNFKALTESTQAGDPPIGKERGALAVGTGPTPPPKPLMTPQDLHNQ